MCTLLNEEETEMSLTAGEQLKSFDLDDDHLGRELISYGSEL